MARPKMSDTLSRHYYTAPPGWASASIVDARHFTVGESTTVHVLTHAGPNLVRGRCGVTAHVVERDGRLAYWSAGDASCLTCLARS